MAEAAGHKWGQIIGEFCESAIEPLLQDFANKHGLYLDKKGSRLPARKGVKVRWVDSYGNGHDLDYVLERGGTAEKIGAPMAFIESAWRRYTKHSKNKAQEITGAVLPIRDKHRLCAPLMGCILAGDYTSIALQQLKSIGFKVLYLPYDSVVTAFELVGINARYNEQTQEVEHDAKIEKWKTLPQNEQIKVWHKLMELNKASLDDFMLHLERAVVRTINYVRIIPLHGSTQDCVNVNEAIAFVESYDEGAAIGPLVRYEVIIRYDNGDKIEAQLHDRASTIEFLYDYQSVNWTPATEELADAVE